ncbi:MAG: DUF177 domain-containing protein [Ruminococcus sp.]|jgi:uncharacterized protein|nr:DUF177 domain-containing protein [Ruminococcus sp.]MBQ1432895.1 DUF177 domain-containing protein [Ruminococcus sp.]
MKMHLKELFDIDGEVKELSFEIPTDVIGEYSSYDFTAPIAVKVKGMNRAGVVTLDVGVDFTLDLTCDRCLKEFKREFVYDFTHTLVRELHGDNDDYVVCENNVLELDELVISDLLLSLPTKILCKEDCKGLCFKCGKDLNEGRCNCSED